MHKGVILKHTGISALAVKLELKDISKVYIAGQFGKYIIISQRRFFSFCVGLLPIEFLIRLNTLEIRHW